MSCCGDNDPEKKEAARRNKEAERAMAAHKKYLSKEVKLLLLGAGESGKSTFAKQMKIIYMDGFSKEELGNVKPVIRNNAINSMKTLVLASKKLDLDLEDENQSYAEEWAAINTLSTDLTAPLAAAIKKLWADPAIQQTYQRRAEFQLIDCAEYTFENIDRLADVDYFPTKEDMLRVRARTTGIIETEFDADKMHFRMVDVGGQRSERKKWIHCFQDVTALIFFVAMNGYDMKLFEDETVNRMHESLQLFDEICNSEWFANTSIILFLNKSDLFKDKVKAVDLKVCFPEYDGGMDFDKASKYIEKKFLELNRNPAEKHIYAHTTCATDTNQMRVVFTAVKDILLTGALEQTGMAM